MKYQIFITGMHCKGCVNLIKMTLEELELLQEIDVSLGNAMFSTDLDFSALEKNLIDLFAQFPDYAYSNLQKIN